MCEKFLRRSARSLSAAVCGTLCFILFILVVGPNVYLWHTSRVTVRPILSLPFGDEESKPSEYVTHERWAFNTTRDANNYALNYAQCDAAFPNLYAEIDRAVGLRKTALGEIIEEDTLLEWAASGVFRLLIHENKLRILETKHAFTSDIHRFRARAVIMQINRALIGASAVGEALPTTIFSVNVDDRPGLPEEQGDTHITWSFARQLGNPFHDRAWLMPDFNFWAWPSIAGDFAEFRGRAAQRDAFIIDKYPQAVWRGAKWTNPEVRGALLHVSENKSWADIREINWADKKDMMPTESFCRYAYVVHTEGRSWSGRMKYLLQCDSVPIVHEMAWTSHYYHLLRDHGAEQNYVSVKRDFSDLDTRMKFYLGHPDEAQRISDNARAAFRYQYLTPAAQACYWRRLISGYAEVAWKVEAYEVVHAEDGLWERRLRGMSFEEFALMDEEYPPTPREV